ncbi:MAG TPA: flagellar basal body P-ring protein FlgI [Pirellulales bacterium]|nr:flagellar basal body P-ring protein FlgI [Pirellulales bacterium]
MKPIGPWLEACGDENGRRQFLKLAAGMAAMGLGNSMGCSGAPFMRSQSPEDTDSRASSVRLVGDLASPSGMYAQLIQAVGLVTGLPGTGSDPPPSPQRAALIAEMEKRGVANPNQVLASSETELVEVLGYLWPGVQKGDRFDVEVRVPAKSEGTGLRGGWLLECRLREIQLLKGAYYDGKPLGLAGGPILVDPLAEGEANRSRLTRGRILGGGVVMETRKLGLVLHPEYQNVMTSAQIGNAINRRFHSFSAGIKQGVAVPENDKHIELAVHPRYKENIERYMRVVRSLPVRESASEQLARVALLERMLLDPITAADAALKLEALGKDGVKSLKKGIESKKREVRFYAGEALAYLDETAAVAPLAEAARVRSFRAYAMAALATMDDFSAYEALRELLDVPSAETRYGAFRALWAMNAHDPLVLGENLADQFSYHLLNTQGPAMVHVTRSKRPEVVLFGAEQRLTTPLALDAGKQIQVNSHGGSEVTVSRFAKDEPDQKRMTSTKLDDVIRAIVALGGTYPDVFQALQQAKATHALEGRLEIDALPQGGRTYDRNSEDEADDAEDGDRKLTVYNPLPGLFARGPGKNEPQRRRKGRKKRSDNGKKDAPKRSFLDKLTRRN